MSCSLRKGPNEVLDYEESYATEMAKTSPNDTISESTWTADSGVVIDSESETTTVAKVWLSGGREGAYAVVENTMVSAAGRTFTRRLILEIAPK